MTNALERKGVPNQICQWIKASSEKRTIISSLGETAIEVRAGTGYPGWCLITPTMDNTGRWTSGQASRGKYPLFRLCGTPCYRLQRNLSKYSHRVRTKNHWYCKYIVQEFNSTVVAYTIKKNLKGLRPLALEEEREGFHTSRRQITWESSLTKNWHVILTFIKYKELQYPCEFVEEYVE